MIVKENWNRKSILVEVRQSVWKKLGFCQTIGKVLVKIRILGILVEVQESFW